MNIVIRSSDNVVIYADKVLSLHIDGTTGDDWIDPHFTTENARIEQADLPAHWTGAAWSYVDGVWAVVDSVRHAQVMAAAAAQLEPVPREVTRRQGLHELRLRDVTEEMVEAKINELIADPLQRDLALIELRTSQTFERYRPLTLTMGAVFSLNLDEVFIAAAKR